VDFIGMTFSWGNILANIYCKVKRWIQRKLSHTIKSRHINVWNRIFMVAKPNSTMLLANFSLLNLRIIARKHGLSFLLFFFSFSFFTLLWTLVHFFLFHSHMILLHTKYLREIIQKNLEHLFYGCPMGLEYFWCFFPV
jgi:hypothetical protein